MQRLRGLENPGVFDKTGEWNVEHVCVSLPVCVARGRESVGEDKGGDTDRDSVLTSTGRGRGTDVNYLPGSPSAACHMATWGLRSRSGNGPGSMAQGGQDIGRVMETSVAHQAL